MEVARAWAREIKREATSVACLAITLTSSLLVDPVSAWITAPITGSMGIVGLFVGATGASGDGEEQLEADQGHVPPGEGVLAVEINSIDSVCLTRLRLPGDEVDEGGGELESELHHDGDKAALLLGLGAQLS
eukprot:UN02743